MICKTSPFTKANFSEDLDVGKKLFNVLASNNIERQNVIRNELRIGLWPNLLPAQFNETWRPSFDAALGVFSQ